MKCSVWSIQSCSQRQGLRVMGYCSGLESTLYGRPTVLLIASSNRTWYRKQMTTTWVPILQNPPQCGVKCSVWVTTVKKKEQELPSPSALSLPSSTLTRLRHLLHYPSPPPLLARLRHLQSLTSTLSLCILRSQFFYAVFSCCHSRPTWGSSVLPETLNATSDRLICHSGIYWLPRLRLVMFIHTMGITVSFSFSKLVCLLAFYLSLSLHRLSDTEGVFIKW